MDCDLIAIQLRTSVALLVESIRESWLVEDNEWINISSSSVWFTLFMVAFYT